MAKDKVKITDIKSASEKVEPKLKENEIKYGGCIIRKATKGAK